MDVRTDYRVLELTGFVQRELPNDQAKRWRHALAGVAHEREHDARILTGYTAGVAWAVINDAPVDPGKAVRLPMRAP